MGALLDDDKKPVPRGLGVDVIRAAGLEDALQQGVQTD
jgi:hypothetical protein